MHFDYSFIEHIARAGGGGSSSGGGGGGGAEFIAAIGYIPSYYLGKLVKKFLPRRLELIVSATSALIFSIILLLVGIQAGFLGGYLTVLVIIGIWLGWASAFFDPWDRLSKRRKAANTALDLAGQADASWNREALLQYAQTVFLQFQHDWSTADRTNLATYMTPAMAYHNSLMLYNLELLNRTNIIADVEIIGIDFINIQDSADNSQDRFTVAIEATANDQLVDTPSESVIYQDESPFFEYWTFVRGIDNSWQLETIMQNTAEPSAAERSVQQFAYANNFYYSLDMGRLFLPRRGQLVTQQQFPSADINNHCIGIWDDLLVQFYTITIDPQNSRSDQVTNKLVAQINVPKNYGGILIRPKRSRLTTAFSSGAPTGYQKFSMEWGDFNDRYEVYAEDAAHLATFELLNPGFMAYLYDADAAVTIEVTDNIIYLYKNVNTVQADEYTKFLTILQKAHKELRQ